MHVSHMFLDDNYYFSYFFFLIREREGEENIYRNQTRDFNNKMSTIYTGRDETILITLYSMTLSHSIKDTFSSSFDKR